MHTTDTQKLIVEAALAMAGVPVTLGGDDRIVEQVAHAMLMIERAGLQSYMLQGFEWSCASRGLDAPEVQLSQDNLAIAADHLECLVHNTPGKASRRIRANRVRRYRAMGVQIAAVGWENRPHWNAMQARRAARRGEPDPFPDPEQDGRQMQYAADMAA